MPYKRWLKRLVLPRGCRLYRIRGGALKGLAMHLDLQVDTQVWRGIYETSLQQWLVSTVNQDDVCIDVGAAEGWATLLMASLACKGQIFSFEPSARGHWIQRNLAANSGRSLGPVVMCSDYVGAASQGASQSPATITLDDFVRSRHLRRLDVVKIDVDGPELEVLDGARDSLLSFRPHLCVEAHSQELLQGVLDRLAAWDYVATVKNPPPHEYRPLACNPLVFGTPAARQPQAFPADRRR